MMMIIMMIACIIPFSGCSSYLEVSLLIYDANRLNGFPVMRISIERHFCVIGKIIFLASRILLLFAVLRLELICMCMI